MRDAAGFAATIADRAPALDLSDSVNSSTDLVQRGEGEAPDRNRTADTVVVRVMSPRIAEVAALLAEGLPNKEIARRLGITEATVKVHLKSAFRHAGVGNRTMVALWYARGGRFSVSHGPPPTPLNEADAALLSRLIAGGFDYTVIRNALAGRVSDDAIVVALRLLKPTAQGNPS